MAHSFLATAVCKCITSNSLQALHFHLLSPVDRYHQTFFIFIFLHLNEFSDLLETLFTILHNVLTCFIRQLRTQIKP